MIFLPLWVFFNLCYFASSSHVYYVVPYPVNDSDCFGNGTILSPCYTFEQFIEDEVSSTLNVNSVVFYLMSGTHVMPENQTLEIRDLNELVIRPWNKQEEVMIKCQLNAALIFRDVSSVKILSMHFTHCTLQFIAFKIPGYFFPTREIYI